jgi:hypothetical protein
MNCDRAQAAVSERMDGERLQDRIAASLDSHLEVCADCRGFADSASRVRAAVRIRPAERIPDLVDPIMADVARLGRRNTVRPRRRRRPAGLRPRMLAPVSAALAVGLVAGSLVVGGPWQGRDARTSASAADVIRRVGVAARHVEAYHATFTIQERGLLPTVPERSLRGELWFSAPGRYRLDVHDTTRYPSDAWTPTDLRYVESGTSVMTKAPTGCPSILPPSECQPTRRVVRDRFAYSTEAPLVTDLVVPLDVLADPRGLTVEGTGTVLGRDAVLVQMSFARAAPLMPFLQMGGTWRPFFPGDRVELWVDAHDWSPLRWTVYPAQGPARADWELLFGRLPEPPDTPILDVTVTSADHETPSVSRFSAAHAAPTVPVSELSRRVGFHPVTPTATQDLALTAASVPRVGDGGAQSLLTYSRGLAYLRLSERRHWNAAGLFGAVDEAAERVRLGDGVAYYEPAAPEQGRRLAIHAADTNLYLETNLSRQDLLAVAASLPLDGQALPEPNGPAAETAGIAGPHLTLAQAQARTSSAFDLPDGPPAGYVISSVHAGTVRGVDHVRLLVRQRRSGPDAVPIRIRLDATDALPPPAAADQERMPLGDLKARWTPSAGRLEWVEHAIYHSVAARGADLPALIGIAGWIEAPA